jgi:hypothetical protein
LSVSVKLFGPSYNWWGLKTDGLRGSQFTLPFSELKHLSADKKTYQMYDAILKVKNDLKNQDEIFSYPSIPIAYLLLKRNFVGTPVLWFDVAGSGDGAFTVSELNKKKPKYIFWLKPPKSVYEGHFNLRKKDPSMIEVDNWLFDSILSNKYQVIKAIEGFGSDIYETAPSSRLKLFGHISNQANFENLNTLCLQIYSCIPSSTITNGIFFSVEIDSGLQTTNFIERANTVFSMPNFVFYVLKRVD